MEVDRYLQAVDEVQRLVSSVSISDSRHEDKLRNILLSQTSSFEPDSLLLDSSASSFATRADLEDTETAPDDGEGEEQEEMNLVLPDGSDAGSSRFSSPRSSCKSTSEIDLVSPEAVSDLRSIVQRMILQRVPPSIRERTQIRHGNDLQAARDRRRSTP